MKKKDMTLRELFQSKEFLIDTNITLSLYRLAEKLGISREDIISGIYDEQFLQTKSEIYKYLLSGKEQ